MSQCSHCHQQLSPDSQICSECATPVADAPGPAQAGPDNIAMPSDGSSGARPPTVPETAQVWQPEYAVPSDPPPGQYPPQGQPGDPGGSSPVPNAPTAVPPGAVPPGAIPPGAFPPGAVPPGAVPPGAVPPGAFPPGAVPPGAFPGGVQPHFVPVGESPSTGRRKMVALGLGVVGLLAVGFLAIRFLLGGSGTGGASSPEDVVNEMVAALNAQDPLALVDLMAPDELDGVDQLVEDGSQYIDDLGLDMLVEENLDDESSFELTVDLEADRVDVSMEGDDAAIVSFEFSGDIEVDGNEEVREALGDDEFSFDSRDLGDSIPTRSGDLEMIVVQLDGKWYFSPMLTAGHYLVEGLGLPSGEYDEIGRERDAGANSPTEAIDALVEVINDPDADALAAALGGGEGRVAVVFRDAIDDAFAEIDTGGLRYELSVETDDIGAGRVEFAEIELRVAGELGDSATLLIEDTCAEVRNDGEIVSDECLLEALDLPDDSNLDTTLWLETVEEDGGRRRADRAHDHGRDRSNLHGDRRSPDVALRHRQRTAGRGEHRRAG